FSFSFLLPSTCLTFTCLGINPSPYNLRIISKKQHWRCQITRSLFSFSLQFITALTARCACPCRSVIHLLAICGIKSCISVHLTDLHPLITILTCIIMIQCY
uniref:Uncharacterized protein n=1 Tax=Kryptolebias marmoratus TaxID=37003 RepID=A0A3Q3A5T7_KRYMA